MMAKKKKDKQWRVGQPTKCTPELIAQFENVLRSGNYVETACGFLGLSVNTFYRWQGYAKAAFERAEKGGVLTEDDKVWIQFTQAVTRARAHAEVAAVARIRHAATEGDTAADQWFLERAFPGRWGRRQHHMEVEIKEPVRLKLNVPTPTKLLEIDED
jgi:hypothetical protein